jgi:fibronectin-binding autotransporter adhesin
MGNKIKNIFFGLAIAFVFLFCAAAPASAAINSQINFQGKVTNPDGTNITSGSYSITFSLYNVASAGTAIWAETDSVTVTNGIFQVNLGAGCPLLTANACNGNTPVDFNNSSIFLGIKVSTDPEMTPRVSLTASPYAFNSDKVGGLTVSQLVQLSPGVQQSGSINVSGNITTAAAAFIQGAATIGSTSGNGQLKFLDGTADGYTGTLQLAGVLAASQTYTLPNTGGTLCVSTNNCSYGPATGGSGYIQNQSASQQATSNFWISGSGRADTSLLTPSLDAAAVGALSIGAGTANALTISKSGVTTTIAGALSVLQASTFTGTVNINTTGTASTAIGNPTGTFSIASSGLNISSTGAISGVTTLVASNTITGLTVNGTSGLNTGAASGTQRLDASGNLLNIGNITSSGVTTVSTTGATGITIKPGSDTAGAFLLQNAANVSFISFDSNTSTLNLGPTTANAVTLNVATGAAIQAVTIGSTNTTSTTSIQGGATGSINIGATGTSTLSSTTNIGTTSDAIGTQSITIGSNANAGNAVAIDAGNSGSIHIGDTTTTHTISIGAGGLAAGALQNVAIGSATTSTPSLVSLQAGNLTTINNQAGVIIGAGFSTTSTNSVPLILDSSTSPSEAANTCTTTVNDGALYYNSNPGFNAVRTCINGNWEDLISTAGAFFAFFGVVPDSGLNPGDLQALTTPYTTGPCKVSWASSTTVKIQPCTAYSAGRKVTVSTVTTLTMATTNNAFSHICLTGTNNQPANTTPSTTEYANLGTVSFPNVNTPIVCLADIKTSASAITGIYDTRVFTTSTKEFGYAAAALPLGVMVKPDSTNPNRLALPGTTATGFMRGIVVASNGAPYSSGGPNVIIATAGDVAVKATAGTLSATATVQNSTTTSGYAITSTTVSVNVYGNLGTTQNTFSNTCSSTANCNSSLLVDLRLR